MEVNVEVCARELVEVVPVVMRSIRAAMRRYRAGDLSVPQFRTLLFIRRNPGASLSEIAEHLGLTPPSASAKIDGLVTRDLVKRRESKNDRRRIHLTLTAEGEALLARAGQETQAYLAERLAALSETEIDQVMRAMQSLRPVFTNGEAVDVDPGG